MASPLAKLGHSQSTLGTRLGPQSTARAPFKEGQSILKNPYTQVLPAKFPKQHVVKQCSQTMLQESRQRPHVSSVRNFAEHNRSRFFEGSPLPLSQSEIISRHPQFLFHSYQQRKLSSSGLFGHLSLESPDRPIRNRTFQDIGTTNNSRRVAPRPPCEGGPVPQAPEEKRFNSTLERSWKEERRHRDNGIECQKVIHQAVRVEKRQSNYGSKQAPPSSVSYKDLYLRTKGNK